MLNSFGLKGHLTLARPSGGGVEMHMTAFALKGQDSGRGCDSFRANPEECLTSRQNVKK